MAYSDDQIRALVSQYGACVYRFALSQMKNAADADDVYQEVFLRLIRSQPEFEGPMHQKAWFMTVTANCCKDFLKKASRRDLPLPEQSEEQAEAEPNDDLQEAIFALDDRARCLIHLFYYEGYRTEEIAEILEMKPSTVRSGLKRARKKLKDFMEGGQE
ncbi:MAG: RNA polymerase sigma factor [Clostridia bacterium]|nr:RNA polymerase sigma factor [Clostridia bacterium]